MILGKEKCAQSDFTAKVRKIKLMAKVKEKNQNDFSVNQIDGMRKVW